MFAAFLGELQGAFRIAQVVVQLGNGIDFVGVHGRRQGFEYVHRTPVHVHGFIELGPGIIMSAQAVIADSGGREIT